MKFELKRWLSVAAALWILCCTAAASAGGGFRDNADYLQGVFPEQDRLLVFLSNPETAIPSPDRIEVNLGGAAVPVTGVERAERQPICYYCLADVSGSLKSEQFQLEKAVMQALCDNLSDGDRMVIAALGNQVTQSGELSDTAEISSAIQALEITHEDTNLYQGLTDSLRQLDSSRTERRNCLVLLSDGADFQRNGLTREEADRAVLDTKIPVYTVALMNSAKKDDTKWLEYAKSLGSFARESSGGQHFNPLLDNLDGASVGTAIMEDMKRGLVVTLDLTGLRPEKDELLLTVTYYTEDGAAYGDAMTVYSHNLRITPPAANGGEEDSKTESETKTESEPEPEPGDNSGRKLVLLTGIGLLVLLAGVCLFIRMRRQRNLPLPEQEEYAQPEKQDNQAPLETDLTSESGRMDEEPDRLSEAIQANAIETGIGPLGGPVREVSFNAIGYEQIHFTLRIPEGRELTLGRDTRAALVLNPNDKKLSGVHCRILLRNDRLWIQDAGSTNGTAVNGVPLKEGIGAFLSDGQTLRVGDYEYRIHFY